MPVRVHVPQTTRCQQPTEPRRTSHSPTDGPPLFGKARSFLATGAISALEKLHLDPLGRRGASFGESLCPRGRGVLVGVNQVLGYK